MYNAEDLIKALRQRPFVPLDLQLATGEVITLTHPEQAVVTETDAIMVFRPGKREGTVAWRLIGLDHVLGIQPSNGTSRSRRRKDRKS